MQVVEQLWVPPSGAPPFRAWRLEHAGMALTVVPERGGKLVSLRHLASATEWLWLNEALPWVPPTPHDSYVEQHDLGGWDECFPSVAATTVQGRSWPDHGDLWWRAWEGQPQPDAFPLTVTGEAYHFERTIRSTSDGFRFDYGVTNTGAEPFPYLWCAHPLLRLAPPLALDLAGQPPVRLGNDSGLGRFGTTYQWPTIAGRSLLRLGEPTGLGAKLFVTVETGEIRLRHPDSGALELRWPRTQLPFLGLWINEEGWSGMGGAPYLNLGVEPATGAPDDLRDALETWQSARVLAHGEQHSWWLELAFLDEP